MVKKKISKKEGNEVKIIGRYKNIDYKFLDNDLLNLKSTITIGHNNNDVDNSNNVTSKHSKINKEDIQRVHKVDLEMTRSRYKGRITSGQSKQSHSSVYE
jgi:hypothetical protein